jgi:glycosyltransferase involved in cell wall biosynthesis
MRILMIAPCPFFLLRGKPIRVLNNTAGLALLGHRVDVVTYPQGEPIDNALPASIVGEVTRNVRLHRIGADSELRDTAKPGLSVRKLLSVPRLYRKAKALLGEAAAGGDPYDCLYGHDIDGALVGTRLKRVTGVPLVYDMHGSFRELMANIHGSAGPLAGFYGLFEKRAYRDADAIFANWPHLVPVVSRLTDPAKVTLVQDKPLLSALEQLERGQKSDTLKRQMGVERLLVYTGNFAVYQRVDILLEMMGLLRQRGVTAARATLVLAGGGGETLAADAARKGLDNVRFIGPKYGDDLSELLMNADVALSPRVTENYPPMKVITYIMARTPTVATDLPSHRQMLTHEQTGLLCPATPEAFADATQRLLDDAALHQRLTAGLDAEASRYTRARLLEELATGLARIDRGSPP